jgi:hypothetical protein
VGISDSGPHGSESPFKLLVTGSENMAGDWLAQQKRSGFDLSPVAALALHRTRLEAPESVALRDSFVEPERPA